MGEGGVQGCLRGCIVYPNPTPLSPKPNVKLGAETWLAKGYFVGNHPPKKMFLSDPLDWQSTPDRNPKALQEPYAIPVF